MERTYAKVGSDGQLTLPRTIQSQLGIVPGTEVEVVLDEYDIRLVIQPANRPNGAEALRIIDDLRTMFKGQPSLEDEYFRTRTKDKW